MIWMVVLRIVFVLALATLGCGAPRAVAEQATAYYVASNGDDGGNGSIDRPWRTLEHALGRLAPGDVLYLRGGTYHEHKLTVSLRGTADAPITIRSYPGERAVIDGSEPELRDAPNDQWKRIDGDIALYRSRRTFPTDNGFVRAWLVDDGVQLIEYASEANLESTHYGPLDGMKPLYMGPGLQVRDDGHIYIRLAYNPTDLTTASGHTMAPVPVDTDPNHHSIAVSFADYVLKLDGARHLIFQDLDIMHADHALESGGGSYDVTFRGCRFVYGYRGLVVEPGDHDWEFDSCEFSNGMPDYVYWTDVKNRDEEVAEAYPEFQSTAINGPMPGFSIHHCLFRDMFDALRVEEGTTHARIVHNTFIRIRDDAINLSRGISDVEVAHNMIWHVMGGIANLASDEAPGPVYIHHNVIDNSAYQRGGRPGNYREDNWPTWVIGSPFPGHDDGDKDSWWRLYNNTIVTRQDPGHQWSAAGPDEVTGNPEKYVLNNIFYSFDGRVLLRDDLESLGSRYDGNVFFRGSAGDLPLFTSFGDGGRYESLRDFRANSGTDWERHGLEIDPGFDVAALNESTFDPATIWERYRPGPAMSTPGAPYDGLDWPETHGVSYRGAVPPAGTAPPAGRVTIFIPLLALAALMTADEAMRGGDVRPSRR